MPRRLFALSRPEAGTVCDSQAGLGRFIPMPRNFRTHRFVSASADYASADREGIGRLIARGRLVVALNAAGIF